MSNVYRQYGIEISRSRLVKDAGLCLAALAVLVPGVGQALDLSLIELGLCCLLGLALVPMIILKGLSEKKDLRSKLLDKILFSMTYRYGLLIQSGHSLRKALLIAMESDALTWVLFPVWHEMRVRLMQGGDYEASLLRLQTLNHAGTKAWARCCLFGERKSEADLVALLHDWMEESKMSDQQMETTSLIKGQLWMMLPALFQFGILMLLLISPIFFGGINT